jgi:hypothetical protein
MLALLLNLLAAGSFAWGVAVDNGISKPSAVMSPERLAALVGRAKELGVDHVRIELPMRETLDIERQGHPAVATVQAFLDAGLDVIAVVGVGSIEALPKDLKVEDPHYIERVAANVHAIAARLAPLGVRTFQVENELNMAGVGTDLVSWRRGQKWWDPDFKAALLDSLARAVKAVDRRLTTSTNFSDNSWDPYDALRMGRIRRLVRAFRAPRAEFERGLTELAPFVDRIGLDYYPHDLVPRALGHLVGLPPRVDAFTGLVGTRDAAARLQYRVERYRKLTGKEVYIAESGYQTRSPTGHRSSGQARYVAELAEAARASGAVGLTYFRLADFRPARQGRLASLFDFSRNSRVEPYFGLLDDKLREKPAARMRWLPIPRRVKADSSFHILQAAIARDRARTLAGAR